MKKLPVADQAQIMADEYGLGIFPKLSRSKGRKVGTEWIAHGSANIQGLGPVHISGSDTSQSVLRERFARFLLDPAVKSISLRFVERDVLAFDD